MNKTKNMTRYDTKIHNMTFNRQITIRYEINTKWTANTKATRRLDKTHNEIGSRPKLEPWYKWAQSPIKNIESNTVTRTKWGVYNKNIVSFHDGPRQMGSSHWDTRYWSLGFAKKAFQPFDWLGIKVHPSKWMNFIRGKNLIFFRVKPGQMGSSHWDTRYLCLGLAKKAFEPLFC